MKTTYIILTVIVIGWLVYYYRETKQCRFVLYMSVGDPVKFYINDSPYYGEIVRIADGYCTINGEEELLSIRTEDLMYVKNYDYQNHEWRS